MVGGDLIVCLAVLGTCSGEELYFINLAFMRCFLRFLFLRFSLYSNAISKRNEIVEAAVGLSACPDEEADLGVYNMNQVNLDEDLEVEIENAMLLLRQTSDEKQQKRAMICDASQDHHLNLISGDYIHVVVAPYSTTDNLNVQDLSGDKRRQRLSNEDGKGSCKSYYAGFVAQVYCEGGKFEAQGCLNKSENEVKVAEACKLIQERNALAFQLKISVYALGDDHQNKVEEAQMVSIDVPTRRHRIECDFNNPKCNTRHLECFKSVVGCTSDCRCDGCENVHGTKDKIT